jgi:hypothetical protein
MADPAPLGNPPRLCQLTGLAYATSGNVTIDVQYNGIQVFFGPVTTTIVDELPLPPPDGDKAAIVCTFESDTTVNGLVPLTIINTSGNGVFYINDIHMPKCFYWTNPDDGTVSLLSSPDNLPMISPNINTVETDGKENPEINGVSIAALRGPEQVAAHTSPDGGIGEWMFRIAPGEIFTCNFLVDLDVLVMPDPTSI